MSYLGHGESNIFLPFLIIGELHGWRLVVQFILVSTVKLRLLLHHLLRKSAVFLSLLKTALDLLLFGQWNAVFKSLQMIR